jgi:hypothetical protein
VLWDDQNHILYSNENECWDNLTGMLDRVFERFTTREHALCFTKAPNFRREVDPTYKLNRQTRKPLCYAALRQRVEGKYNCLAMPGLEADDIMGILATKPGQVHNIIVSQDKDMKGIPGADWKDEYEPNAHDFIPWLAKEGYVDDLRGNKGFRWYLGAYDFDPEVTEE